MADRRIILENTGNCRQLGGLVTSDGRTIKNDCLLRSANLSRTSRKDLEILCGEHRLRTVVDLRTMGEIREKPDVYSPRFEYIHMPIFDDSIFGLTHERSNEERKGKRNPVNLVKLYTYMVSEKNYRINFGKALTRIMSNDFSKGSVLWHCSEGKDRCGMTAAFLLTALGVERPVIIDDYLMTNETNGPKAEYYHDLVMKEEGDEELAEMVRNVFLAKREYIETAISVIEKDYGSLERYLTEGLFIDPDVIEKFRENVLE